MSAVIASDDHVPPEIVSSVFYSASVSDALALLVAETSGRTQRIAWANEGAVQLLGYALVDLSADYEPVPIVRVSCGQLREDDVVPVLDVVRADADELRRAMLAD